MYKDQHKCITLCRATFCGQQIEKELLCYRLFLSKYRKKYGKTATFYVRESFERKIRRFVSLVFH